MNWKFLAVTLSVSICSFKAYPEDNQYPDHYEDMYVLQFHTTECQMIPSGTMINCQAKYSQLNDKICPNLKEEYIIQQELYKDYLKKLQILNNPNPKIEA